MVSTRSSTRASAPEVPGQDGHAAESVCTTSKSWAETHGVGDHSGAWGLTGAAGTALAYAGAVALMVGCPAFAIYLWFTLTKLDGSLSAFYYYVQRAGVAGLRSAWPWPSAEAAAHVACFGALQAALQLGLPGRTFKGPVSPRGNVPVYKANGVQAYAVTLALFFAGWRLGAFSPARVYELFGEILSALNLFSLAFCGFLYAKGRCAPSTSDAGTTGSLLYDFYWGMELYPRLGRAFDLKTWTNCRMGMMGWAVLALCYAAAQVEREGALADSMAVSVLLMQLYIFKFFLWETGYWCTMDIAHDRAGYYLCWGCLVWVPAVYTSPTLFLVSHPVRWGAPAAAAIAAAGAAAIYINYDSDRQRQVFRESGGRARVWGAPPKKLTAQYTTGDGTQKTSLLLLSGWWGLARHFHYLPELAAAFFWCLPAGGGRALPFFYFFPFLTLLLLDRAFRDDARCAAKYGAAWAQYCKAVPYRMIPYVF